MYGNKWSSFVREFPGRTDSQIKNRFQSSLSKRLHEDLFSVAAEEALEELKTTGIRKRDEKLIRKVKSSPASPDTGKMVLSEKVNFQEKLTVSKVSELSCST